ncbi:TPA_asm: L [Dryobalanops betacytorhabdovirus 1]|nr:TPA_asm: L [Dryobalanops betacytorhabdovirus 1]
MEDYLNLFDGSQISEDFSTGFMEDLFKGFRSKNISGLGDFHLRSAVKKANIEKLKINKARYRENQDYRNFSQYINVEKQDVLEGIPCELLSYFLLFKNILVDELNSELLHDAHDQMQQLICDVTKRRIIMELNRNMGKNLIDSNTESLREKFFSGVENGKDTGYDRIRCFTEYLILISSSIASKRTDSEEFEELGTIISDGDKNNILFITSFCNISLVVGGDLIFVKWEEFEIKRTISNFLNDSRDEKVSHSDYIDILGNEFYKRQEEGKWFVFNGDVLRMINDKMSERDIVIRSCLIMNDIHPTIYPNTSVLQGIFDVGDILLMREGNKGYKAIKCYEALMTGVLLSKCDNKIVSPSEFLETTIRDLTNEFPEFTPYIMKWIEIAECCTSDHHISQLYGLYRLWGHPYVNSQEGLKKVKKLGTAKKHIIEELAKKAGYSFLEEIFLRYKKKWGRYPAFRVILSDNMTLDDMMENSYLIKCLCTNEKFKLTKDIYLKSDWDRIDIQKTFDVPDTFNLTMVIDDKAISPPKSFLIKVAMREVRYMDPYERRGVLKWMNEDYIKCHDFLRYIDEKGLDDDDCVIGLYPKERELNSVPRMFALMSAKMRNYVVVTEHMIADDLLPFFPQVTMTDDLLSLTKKIYNTTSSQRKMKLSSKSNKYFDEVSVCLNMDFEKWNLNMRYDATKFVFEQMGKLYGMPSLFNRTYEIFEKSYVYLSDENVNLNTEINHQGIRVLKTDGITSYIGHIGGFEGLRQKGWTIFTVSVIRMILSEFPVKYKLMGQGDNQVLMITIRTNKINEDGYASLEGIIEMKTIINNIISSLENIFLGLGLPLKTLESWKSEEFFLYGKFPVKRGIPLSMSLKRLSRSFPFSNEDSMTIDNVLGSVFTNAQAAAMSDVTHIPSYYLGLMETFRGASHLLRWHPLLGEGLTDIYLSDDSWFTFENIIRGDNTKSHKINFKIHKPGNIYELAEMLCIYPKSLGGSNGISEYEFMMRGFPDNQSRDFTYLTELIKGNKNHEDLKIKKVVTKLYKICRLILSKSENFDFLIEDPCALNILMPQTPITVLRKKIKKTLSETVTFKNKNFMELFKLSNDQKKRELLIKLAEGDRLFPRILHDCYAASLFGFVDGIVSKVDKTVTVQRMCLETSNEDIMLGICNVEKNYLKYLMWRVDEWRTMKYDNEPSLKCPTNYIRWARDFGWGKVIEGVTVPYPSHILKYNGDNDIINCHKSDYISCHVSDYLPNNEYQLVNKLGNSPPYLGSYTKEKIKKYDRVALYSSEPLLRRIIRMIKVLNWSALENSNLSDYLIRLLNAVSDVDHNIFTLAKDDIGGTLEHRYKDSALKHGALSSSMYGLGTWIHMSTDNFGEFTKGSKNVTLHFQAILCWVQSVMCEKMMDRCHIKDPYIKEYHFHLSCTECIKSVEYDIPDIPKIQEELIPSLRDNPYCYTNEILLTEKDRSINSSKDLLTFNKTITLDKINIHDISLLYHEYWAAMIFKDIIDQSVEEDDSIGTNVLELSKYPRISFLRVNVQLLLEYLIAYLTIWQYQIEEERDIYEQTSLKFQKILDLIKIAINQTDISKFVGLSILFSWPEKIQEILSISKFDMPISTSLSTRECLIASKKLLLSKLNEISDISWLRTSKYINLSEAIELNLSLMIRYMNWYKIENFDSCHYCKRNVIKNFKDEKLWSLTGKETCKAGHFWFNKSKISKELEVICIPEDNLSKRMTITKLVPKKRLQNELANKRNSIHIITENFWKFKFFSSVELHYESRNKIVKNVNFTLRGSVKRTLNRSIPSQLSSGYRLIDMIVGLQAPVDINKQEILSLGDGSSTSGFVINYLLGCKISTSSLVDCTLSFPQTFGHSVPTAQFLTDYSLFDNSLEKRYVNNIFSDEFCEVVKSHVLKKNINICVCDIELEHEESMRQSDEVPNYGRLIERIWKIGTSLNLIKLRCTDSKTLFYITEKCASLYNSFGFYISPFCNSEKGEFFAVLMDQKHTNNDNFIIKSATKNKEIFLSVSTRQNLINKFSKFCRGEYFSELDQNYYDAVNDIIMIDDVLNMSISNLTSWFSAKRLNFDPDMKNFTKFYHSIAASKNPKEFSHHTDNKLKYEYNSSVLETGERMFILGLSLIENDYLAVMILERYDDYVLCRPVIREEVDGMKFIKRYTYEIIHKFELKNLIKSKRGSLRYNVLPIHPIKLSEESKRYIPLLRLINRSNNQFQDISSVKRISFEYISKTNIEKLKKKGKQDYVRLLISKSCYYTLITK